MTTHLPADTHIHTVLCRHASGMPLEYARAAFNKGVAAVCMTDHVPAPDGYDSSSRMDWESFPLYREAVEEARREFPGRVTLGVEADYYPGCESYLPRFLESAPFDFILGSVHYIGDWGFDNPAYLDRWRMTDVRQAWQDYATLARELVRKGWCDALSHLDLPKKFGHRLPDGVLRDLMSPLLDEVASAGLAVELNTGGLRKPVREIYPSPLLLSLMKERDIPILFGSDAHAPEEAGEGFGQAVRLAREAGYTEYARFEGRRRRMEPLPG